MSFMRAVYHSRSLSESARFPLTEWSLCPQSDVYGLLGQRLRGERGHQERPKHYPAVQDQQGVAVLTCGDAQFKAQELRNYLLSSPGDRPPGARAAR